jgi:threonine dehydratase
MVRKYVDAMVRLDDATILSGVRFAFERMKQVLEPAGAAALAAFLHRRVDIVSGERVCVVASGGNVETSRIGELLAAAAPLPAPSVVG